MSTECAKRRFWHIPEYHSCDGESPERNKSCHGGAQTPDEAVFIFCYSYQERGNMGHTGVLCSMKLEELNYCKEIQTMVGGHGA